MAAPIRVLHVDDQPQFGDLTKTYLERIDERFGVETATSASEGLDRLEAADYDCVVSDYEMPERDGIEFLEAVRESYPALPFILFTGKGSEAVASEAISAGVSDYLQKKTSSEQYELLANRILNHVERTRTQRELKERESHLRQAQAVANIGSWERDVRADEIYWSDEVYEIFGIDDDETLISHDQFLGFVHPDDRDAVDEAWSAALDGEEYDVEHRIVTGDGEVRWVRERAELTFDDDGAPVNALGIVQDITERKQREDELRKTSARLDALFQESPDMINFHDAEGNIIKPNPRLCELTGYSEAELTEMAVWELDQSLDREEALSIWRGMEPGDSLKVEGAYRCRDGSTLPVEVHLRCLDRGDEDRFVVISRDIRERQAREAELERQNERVERFVDALAHDIPNHLDTAALWLELAREERSFEHVDRVETAHTRIETLIEELQTLVRAGTPVDDEAWLDLSAVANACWKRCRSIDDRAELRVVDDGRIRAHESRFKQLLENLFWNAVEHGSTSPASQSRQDAVEHAGDGVTVRVGLCEDGFYVADDGIGIPADEHSEVLSPRYTTAGEHRGFGLAIVDEIANAHGWDVRVTDSEEGGARFEITGVETDPE
jgi:PAS domain S-box-containing protein